MVFGVVETQQHVSPADGLSRRVVELMITPSETRDRLCEGIFRSAERGAPMGELHEVMKLTLEITPLEKKIRRGVKEGKISAPDIRGQIDQALAASESRRLEEVRREGGRILLTQVPPLTRPEQMHSAIDERIQQLLGLDGDSP